MRWNVLWIGLVVFWLAATPLMAQVAVPTTPMQTVTPPIVGGPGADWPTDAEGWLGETMLDWLTIPLGTADREDCWPWVPGGMWGKFSQ